MHLITGYAGKEHVSAADQGAFNAAVISTEKVVLPTGERFKANKISNNLIQIESGDALINGRHINIPYGESEKCVIDSCGVGFQRYDVIAIRYIKNVNTLVESAELVVLKGDAVTRGMAPLRPTVSDGNILERDQMCEFPLYLVKIEDGIITEIVPTFREEKNVTQMNDMVGKMNATVSQIKETMDLLATVSIESVEYEGDSSYIWGYATGLTSHLVRIPTEAEGGESLSVKLPVKPKEVYRITADNGYYMSAGIAPIIATVWAMGNGGVEDSFGIISETYEPLKDSENVYVITIPESCEYLMINSCSETLIVEKLNSEPQSSGMKILWSGLLNCDGYVGLNNEGVEFSIPKDCFFNDGKELILAINGYCPEDHFSTFPLLITGMCFGTDEDFGFSPNSGQYPYKCGDFSRYILHEERFVTESSSNYSVIRIDVHVKKVADSRYAVCTVQNRSSHFYITSISAVLAG